MRSFGQPEFMFVVLAARWTILLSAVALFGGGLAGMALTLAGISRHAWLRRVVTGYTQLIQGTPLLVLILMTYFGLGAVGVAVDAFTAASAALVVYASAFLCTIWRASIDAVPRTQWESAASLGIGTVHQLWYVILPQGLRLALAPTTGFVVQVIKNTSLASIIGFVELTRAGQMVSNVTFQPLPAFAAVALVYFVLCLPFTLLTDRLEQRSNHGIR